jgi:hypothetical protein
MEEMDRAELQRLFGGRFVAHTGQEVVASAATYPELANILSRVGIDRSTLIIEYIEPADVLSIY